MPRSSWRAFECPRLYKRPPRSLVQILVVTMLTVAWTCLPSIAQAAPLTAKTAGFDAHSAGTYVDDSGKEQDILSRKLRTQYDTSVLYTFRADKPELNKTYQLGNERIVRKQFLNQIRWIAREHREQGQPLQSADSLRELAAVQLCIWSYDDREFLSPQRVPDHELRSRAGYLRRRADANKSTPPQTVLRTVELDVDTVRSTATKVEIEVRLDDTESGESLPGQSIMFSYDGKPERLKTDDRGRFLVLRQRLDRKVEAEALWEGRYEEGALWFSDDASQPELIQAEALNIKLHKTSVVDPANLKSGLDLMYQTIGDALAEHTPLGPQPAALIGLIALGGGWAILAARTMWALIQARKQGTQNNP